MHTNESRFKSIGRGAIVLTALAASAAFASDTSSTNSTANEPLLVVAQAGTYASRSAASATATAFPAHEAGVRAAAAQGPDALRRYTNRTRMIYNFYYWDFAPKN